MLKGIHHIALNCRDNLKTEAFYKKWFGFNRALTFTDAKGDPVIFIRLENFYLELFKLDDKIGGTGKEGGEQLVGFKHFCFEVDSVEDYYRRMKEEVEFTVEPMTPPPLPHLTLAFFKDHDGNIVQLTQGWQH